MGAGSRLRNLGHGPGLGPARADRECAGRDRRRARSPGPPASGAASSSCSYAAIAIARSLFAKGASAAGALAFQFASTNLVWELGLVLWVLLGWQFTVAEFVGGMVMIALMAATAPALRLSAARGPGQGHAQEAGAARPSSAAASLAWRQRLGSTEAWGEVARYFLRDWRMLWKEITIGFLLAGFIGLLGDDFFNALFIKDAPPTWSRRSRTSSSGR